MNKILKVRQKIESFGHVSVVSQSTITCSKLTTETLEQSVKYVQS